VPNQSTPPKLASGEQTMEEQLSTVGYWLGLICTGLAVIFRILNVVNVTPPHLGSPGANAISYMTFFHAAAIFFLLSIASWCRNKKL
jgi:branched-subunit amino acid ABC-type transport system permease component